MPEYTEIFKEILPAGGTCYLHFGEDASIADGFLPGHSEYFSQIVGRKLGVILPPTAAAAIIAAMTQQPHERECICLEYSLTLPDGEHRYEAQLLSLPEKQFVLLAYDLAPREEYSATGDEIVTALRAIFESALEGIFQTSPDGHYLFVNPALAVLYGYESPADLVSGITDIQKQLYVDPGRRKEFARLMRKHGCVAGFESPIRHRDGSVIWIVENARQICDAAGVLRGYEGVVVDITARVNAKNQQRKEQETLSSRIETGAGQGHNAS